MIADCNAKVGSQVIPGVTGKFGLVVQNKGEQRLTEFFQENAWSLQTPSSYTWFYTWTSPDGQYQNQVDCILCSWRWWSSIQSANTRLGADCGLDHELLIAKFRLKLKKVGKSTRPFRYDQNQIPCDYTVKVRNRLKGLDLIECLKNYGQSFITLYRRQWSKSSPRKRNAKMIVWGDLQIPEKRREAKGKGKKERYVHLNAEFQRIARRGKKAFLSEQYKGIEENNRMGKTSDLFMKIRGTKETFHAKMGT